MYFMLKIRSVIVCPFFYSIYVYVLISKYAVKNTYNKKNYFFCEYIKWQILPI